MFDNAGSRIGAATAPVVLVLGLALGLGCGGTDPASSGSTSPDAGSQDVDRAPDTAKSDGPPPASPGVPSDIETVVTSSPPTVGTALEVRCDLLDQHGDRVAPPSEPETRLVYAPSETFEENDADELVPVETGPARVACAAPSLSLVDDSPATFDVRAGPPHTVRTTLDANKVSAGTSVEASCRVFDRYDNRIERSDPSVRVDAMGDGIEVDGRTVTIEKADIYSVSCHLPGAKRIVDAPLEITPGPAASIALTPVPKKSAYDVGEVIRFSTVVNDAFGNEVRSARVSYSIVPTASSFGRARWAFDNEGEYTVSATVTSPTKGGGDLTATETIVVSGSGPEIDCEQPANGTMIDRRPGTNLQFQGSAEDPNGISSIEVDGVSQNVGNNGSFSASIPTEFGMNFVDVTATDQYGAESTRTCAFLVADDWNAQDRFLGDSTALDLQQSALDDGVHAALNSVADLFDRILNSSQLEVDLDDRLWNDTDGDGDNNYWLKDSCDATTIFGCAHYSKVKHLRDPSGGAPGSGITSSNNTVSLDWVSNGIDISTSLRDVGIRLFIDSSVCGNVRGWVRVSKLDVDVTTDVDLSNHQLEASPRSTSVSVGNVNPDFGGVCGGLADVLQGLLQDTMQNAVKQEVRRAIRENLPSLLDSLLSSLDVSSLGRSFSVPEFDGSGSVSLDFNVRISSLEVDHSHALVGVGTKFTTFARNGSPSKGVALPTNSALHDPRTNDDAAASVFVGVFNHVLHALWRGGLFDAEIDTSTLGGSLPEGATARLSSNLPPVATVEPNGDLDIAFGGATLSLTYPGLFDQPVEFDVGAVVRTGADLRYGESVKFENVQIRNLYFSPRGLSLDPNSRATIEGFLETIFQRIVDRALNKGLRTLPIPSFEITPALGQYDLPTGRSLGLLSGSIESAGDHLTMEGNFGQK